MGVFLPTLATFEEKKTLNFPRAGRRSSIVASYIYTLRGVNN